MTAARQSAASFSQSISRARRSVGVAYCGDATLLRISG
jgi:hypothetical protein